MSTLPSQERRSNSWPADSWQAMESFNKVDAVGGDLSMRSKLRSAVGSSNVCLIPLAGLQVIGWQQHMAL
jgi:hypothetical protein